MVEYTKGHVIPPALLILFILSFLFGVYNYSKSEVQISHFSYLFDAQGHSAPVVAVESYLYSFMGHPSFYMIGEIKTNAPGFFVGDNISISIYLQVDNGTMFDSMKNLSKDWQFVSVKNSESPRNNPQKISEQINTCNRSITYYSGLLTPEFCNNQVVVLKGDVIFTQEGPIKLAPSKFLQNQEDIDLGISIAPSYAKYQTYSNKIMTTLTYFIIGLTFLQIFFMSRNGKEEKKEKQGKASIEASNKSRNKGKRKYKRKGKKSRRDVNKSRLK